jgi:hypothetical protein
MNLVMISGHFGVMSNSFGASLFYSFNIGAEPGFYPPTGVGYSSIPDESPIVAGYRREHTPLANISIMIRWSSQKGRGRGTMLSLCRKICVILTLHEVFLDEQHHAVRVGNFVVGSSEHALRTK